MRPLLLDTCAVLNPGDKYVDVIGIDDYSIGHGDVTKAESALARPPRLLAECTYKMV